MAENYKILSVTPDVQLVPPNRTQPVRVIAAQADPSDVEFFFVVVKGDFNSTSIGLIAHSIASALNRDALLPGVEEITISEAVNASLGRYPTATVLVSSTSGQSEDEIVVRWGVILDGSLAPKVEAARAKLDDIEAL
jgi:hypothetical protein